MRYNLLYFKRTNIHPDNLELLKKKFDLLKINTPNDIQRFLKNKENIVAVYVDQNFTFQKKFFKKLKNIKYVLSSTTSTGFIDEKYCKNNNIKIFSLEKEQKFLEKITPTAEHVFGLINLISRNYLKAIQNVDNGFFDRKDFPGNKMLSKSTLGIIGFGRLGKVVKKIAIGFNMKIITYDIKSDKKSKLKKLLDTSDFISLNIPLRNNKNFFSKKKTPIKSNRKIYLINTSRGEIVDEKYVLYLLRKKIMLGYATDVISNEFNIGFNIKKNILFKNRKKFNVIITPHIGGSTKDAWKFTQNRVIKLFLKSYK